MGLGYWVKRRLMTALLDKRRRKSGFDADRAERFELPADAPKEFNNSYYFTAHGLDGQSLFVRVGKRNGSPWEIWMAVKTPAGVWSDPVELAPAAKAPVQVELLESMRRWHVSYSGVLALNGVHKPFALDAVFTATGPIYDFGTEAPSANMAAAIARQKWSREYFAELSANNQVHYEQPGVLTGTMAFGTETPRPFTLPAVRDHSFGQRAWDYMDRHLWLCALGPQGKVFQICVVSYPVLKDFATGYSFADGRYLPVTKVVLSGFERNGREPSALTAVATVKGLGAVTLKAQVPDFVHLTFADVYDFYEGLGDFTVGVTPYRGIVEFGYSRDARRW